MDAVQKLTPDDFPTLLSEINDPPPHLYMRGALPKAGTKYLTVVGSRSMSQYGKDACEYLIAGLTGYPISIVSGLALGMDGCAHRAALKSGLHTIALPGSGINDDVLYPHTHKALAKQILSAGGALLSEFEPDHRTMIHYFPQRNRIMAGMSDAILVVEAGVRSGTLITARLATEYNRTLLIVPHSIFSDGGAGGHVFAKIGAQPVRTAADILEALDITPESSGIESVLLTDDERAVLECLSEPMERDEVIRQLTMKAGAANVLVAQMEIRGLIAESLGQMRKLI